MKKYSLLVLCILVFRVSAQQDPIYSQYLTNPITINPAYAGINNQFNARVQFRTQWAGLDANPQTFNANGNISIVQNKVGLGLMLLHDQLGDIRNMEFSIPVSYKIRLKESYISFGMQAGFVNQRNNPNKLTIRDPGDPAFNSYSETVFNLGTGVMLKHDKYKIGFSVPRLLPTTINPSGSSIELYRQQYYLFGSYNHHLNDKLWLKPSVLIRGTSGAPLSFDLNATMTFREYYSGGLFTRNFNSYGALLQVLLNNYCIAYVFELPGGKNTNPRFTSHEISISISKGLLTYHDLVPKVF